MPAPILLLIGLAAVSYIAYRVVNPICSVLVAWVFNEADRHPRARNRILIAGLVGWFAQIVATPFIVEIFAKVLPTSFSGPLIACAAGLLILQTGLVAIHVVTNTSRRQIGASVDDSHSHEA